jgi:hypothetical protein
MVFKVSPNPGDNHRANVQIVRPGYAGMYDCTVPQGVMDGHLDHAGGGSIPATEVTPMLTVWRRFHVECDTMAGQLEYKDRVDGLVSEYDEDIVWVLWWRNDKVWEDDRFDPGGLL